MVTFENKSFSNALRHSDVLIVGAGLFGLTIAERAACLGYRPLIIDRRPHIGGNAYCYIDSLTGIEVHKYGPHLFHTNSELVYRYLSEFTEWEPFELRVWTNSGGQPYPMPISLATISQFLRKTLTPTEAREWVIEHSEAASSAGGLEGKAVSLIGRPLYEAFIKGYTAKQWQTDPSKLPGDIITRLPIRYTFDTRYFSDVYQCLPTRGYNSMFERMMGKSGINIVLGVDWFDVKQEVRDVPVVFTGPIDRFFDYKYGLLGWRTLDFEMEHHPSDYQGCLIMNYPDLDVPWTRITEYRHLYPNRDYGRASIISKEYSRFAGPDDEPYYPINTTLDKERYDAYRLLADGEVNVVFGGRLGTYRYLDMHQAVGSALKAFESQVLPLLCRRAQS